MYTHGECGKQFVYFQMHVVHIQYFRRIFFSTTTDQYIDQLRTMAMNLEVLILIQPRHTRLQTVPFQCGLGNQQVHPRHTQQHHVAHRLPQNQLHQQTNISIPDCIIVSYDTVMTNILMPRSFAIWHIHRSTHVHTGCTMWTILFPWCHSLFVCLILCVI